MINYIYDGSFEGLLTAIHEAFYRRENPAGIFSAHNLQTNLLDSNIYVSTDILKYEKVQKAIIEKISSQSLQDLFYVFLSENINAGTWIYRYLKLGFRMGCKVESFLTDETVHIINKTSQRVLREYHRMLGLLRFKLIAGNVYYAAFRPDNNIVALLAPHFEERLPMHNWIIHDVKRNLSAVYDCSSWVLTDMEISPDINLDDKENDYNGLWKQYFKSIAIESRRNPRLQKNFMPKRYWDFLPEKQP